MKLHLGDVQGSPNLLARHYSRFRVAERMLLTGHSHQAWPDVGFEAQKRAWLDAAELVDAKWERAFEKWTRVCEGYAALLGDTSGDVTLASSTHTIKVGQDRFKGRGWAGIDSTTFGVLFRRVRHRGGDRHGTRWGDNVRR